ncbi:hypothetical protein A8B82_16270 [Sulfitobacter sp. EhC04]|uniref:NAD(P)-dependent oxidoreductase n=1 Tax=Sulfitobacter sp. EhC04 TaxID=1849168 RepID=UPI0007F4731B|nr:NAD(P)-dependent oxidoreductase [Sulfitobacter sp. EhC04]OAN75950.1 hypothetical protein A8B82_16270 [Sulfitobacter sp. EhC04]
MKVGYIGLGAMGGSLVKHLLGKFDLSIWDINETAVNKIVSLGARKAESAATLARDCDVIILCLPRSSDVDVVLFGEQGLATSLAPGKLVIDQTSGVPAMTNMMAERLSEQGVLMLDAPLSGGIPAAKSGIVSIIASGSDAAWAIAEPILSGMSSKVFRSGSSVGNGQALKLINNAIGAIYRLSTLELTALACKSGIPMAAVVERLNYGPAANFTTRGMLVARLGGKASTDFALALMLKDINEALTIARTGQVPMPLTYIVRDLMQTGLNHYGKEARLETVIPLIETISGASISAQTTLDLAPMQDCETQILLADIESAVEICNLMAAYECISVGLANGLDLETMRTVLDSGSAWSDASMRAFEGMSQGTDPAGFAPLGEMVETLQRVTRQAAVSGVPLFFTNRLLSDCEAGHLALGEAACVEKIGLHQLARSVHAGSPADATSRLSASRP